MKTLQDIPTTFPAHSQVWVYQCSRPLREKEVLEIDDQLHNFYSQWQSHGAAVQGWAAVLYNQMIVVVGNEPMGSVSGCSTDGMVRVIKSIERQYSIQLFDRLSIAFLVNEKVEPLPIAQVGYALGKGYITENTLLFNNTVSTYEMLNSKWLQPLNESWLWERVKSVTTLQN